jgi:hypothetical protein
MAGGERFMEVSKFRNLVKVSIGIIFLSVLLILVFSERQLTSIASVLGAAANLLAFMWIAATFQLQAKQLELQNSALIQQLAATKSDIGISLYESAVKEINEVAKELYLITLDANHEIKSSSVSQSEIDSYIRAAFESIEFRRILLDTTATEKLIIRYLCERYIAKSTELKNLLESEYSAKEIADFLYKNRPVSDLHKLIESALNRPIA